MSDSESDCESWKYSWEGHIFMLNESKVLIEKQLTEIEDGRMAQRHVLALARYKKNEHDEWDIPIMLRIRYDINPKPFGIKDIEENRKDVHEHVLFELELIRHLHSAGKGPELLNSVRHGQIPTLPYPPGFVYFFALERVPGEDLDRIRDDLSLSQLRSIKKQLAGILDVMRPLNRCLAVEDPRCLRYDKAKDKLYLVDLTHWGYQYMETIDRITEDSAFVEAFGLWLDEQQIVEGPLPVPLVPPPPPTASPSGVNVVPGRFTTASLPSGIVYSGDTPNVPLSSGLVPGEFPTTSPSRAGAGENVRPGQSESDKED